MTEKMKADFLAMGLRSQLRKVIKVHYPSNMRMVYMQVVGIPSLKPSIVFYLDQEEREELKK
jgi:hypothetical protein